MQTIINYFNTAPDWHRVLLFCGITFLIWNLENLKPLFTGYHKWKHARYNILFLLIVTPVQVGMGYFINDALHYTANNHIGLLQISLFENQPLFVFLVGFVLLDLGEYVYHVIMHKGKRLWLIHAVHHLEEDVDVSTGLREHPAETGIRMVFLIGFILLLGIPIWALLFRQFIQIGFVLFSHANYHLPKKINDVIALAFITPNLHHVHHHSEQPYTDSNFGDVLSIWDRMFGTFYNGKLDLVYGVDTFMENEKSRDFKYLFFMPFMKDDHPEPKYIMHSGKRHFENIFFNMPSAKAIKIAFIIVIVSLVSVMTFGQAPKHTGDIVIGKWMSAENDLEIEVYKQGNEFYGKIIWFACQPAIPPMEEYLDENNPSKSLRSRHWVGMNTLLHLRYAGNNKWENGKVYEPNSGHTYSATATLESTNTVKVRGYWGFEMLGKTLTFNRVK